MENENEDIVLKTEQQLENILKKAIESPNMPQIFFYDGIEELKRLTKLFFELIEGLNKSIHLVLLSGTKASIEYILEEV